MNFWTILLAILYALEIPFGVWSGIEIDHHHYWRGGVIIIIIMLFVIVGVVTFIKAQSIENRKEMEKRNNERGNIR